MKMQNKQLPVREEKRPTLKAGRIQGGQICLWQKSPKMLPNPFFVQNNTSLILRKKLPKT
jgi:hypothetical protein